MRIQASGLLLLWWFTALVSISPGAALELEETDDVIRVTLRGKPVLEYVKSERPLPEGVAPEFRRSGYIHPVFSPLGQEVTGDFPADHPHQHALFLAWTRSRFDGRKTDFWNQAKETGRIEHREVIGLKRADHQVSFSVRHAFVVGSAGQETDALHEIWTVTVFATPEDHFLFDVESVQECATDKPFKHEKYHYGGMAFRGRIEWLKENAEQTAGPGEPRFLTSEGRDRWEGNHTRPNWVAMSGRLEGQPATVVGMCHPGNFRAPQSVRLHPDKPYFCFAPMVEGAFVIEPGEQFVSRYRFVVKSAEMEPEAIGKFWREYAGGAGEP